MLLSLRMAAQAEMSSVAASGIASVSCFFHARKFRKKIVSVALSSCQFRNRTFNLSVKSHQLRRNVGVTTYVESPSIQLSGLSWEYQTVPPEDPVPQREASISQKGERLRIFRLCKYFLKNFLYDQNHGDCKDSACDTG